MQRIAVVTIASILAWPRAVYADDDVGGVLDAPAPPTLPALAHRDLVYTLEYTAASIQPNPSQDGASNAYAWFLHNDVELPVVPRRWYIGAAQDIGAAAVPGVGRAIVPGNPEITGRGLWSSVRGLSSGGTLGLVLPVPRALSDAEAEVVRTLRVVRPWDVAYFEDLTITFRPSFDIRHVTGRFMFQLRQGVDWSIALRATKSNEPGTDLTARVTFYTGFRASRSVGLGLELWEVYQVTAELPDDKRAAFAISPSLRLMFPRVQPAVSLLFPIATPLRGEAGSYYAARLNVGFAFPFSVVPSQ